MVWRERVNNLVEKVNGGNGNLIFAPVFELDEGKCAVFGVFNVKNDHGLSAVVGELKGGGGGGGVSHGQSVGSEAVFRKNFLRFFADFFLRLREDFS
jgi:hypothetical protein